MDQQSESRREFSILQNETIQHQHVIESLADKLLNVLDLQVLDFKDNPVKTIYINQLRSSNQLIKLKRPLKVLIKKENDFFIISQEEISIDIYDYSFRKALKLFQERLISEYEALKQNIEVTQLHYFFKQYI